MQVRGIAEEVLRRGVLVQPADQVGDGVDELVLARHRRVQEHVARGLLQGPAHMVGHALEHLEVEQVGDAFGLGQHRGVGQFEQVVRGHAQVDRGDVVRLHAEGDHALVVGVHLELVVIRRQRPVVEHRLELLHLHVGALDDAQLDRRAAGRDPSPGPLGQLPLDGEAVRQVGLEDDAGRVVAKLLLFQGGDEGLVGDLQVAVLLHVQVDELGHPGTVRPDEEVLFGHPVDGREPLDQGGHGVLEVERADLREDGRDLDRDVLDVRILHVADVGGQPVGRLPLAEHRLAQVVDVHADALGLAPLQMGVQFLVLARDDGPAAAGAHLLDELGHGHGGEVLAHADEHLHDQLLHPAEKGRHALVGHQAGQLVGHPFRVVRAEALVDHAGEQYLVPRVGEQPFHLLLDVPLLLGEELVGAVLPLFGQGDGLFDDLPVGCVHGRGLVHQKGRLVAAGRRPGRGAPGRPEWESGRFAAAPDRDTRGRRVRVPCPRDSWS